MSIFKGKEALRTNYSTLTFAELAGANSKTNAKLWHVFAIGGRLTFLHNATDQEIAVYAVHPEANPSTDDKFKLLMFEMCAGQVLNFVSGNVPSLEFDPGAQLMAAWTTLAPTTGKIKLSTWG